MNFHDKKTTQKGEVGENLVNKYLEDNGFIVYKPITDNPHAFDRLAIKNKEILIIAEVKTKARRLKYPDTGFNINHYNTYKNIQTKHNLNVFMFFVDEENKSIYGNWIKELEKEVKINHNGRLLEYPLRWDNIIYFPLANMKKICDISDCDAKILSDLTTKNEIYLRK